jgi:hypothetical protein
MINQDEDAGFRLGRLRNGARYNAGVVASSGVLKIVAPSKLRSAQGNEPQRRLADADEIVGLKFGRAWHRPAAETHQIGDSRTVRVSWLAPPWSPGGRIILVPIFDVPQFKLARSERSPPGRTGPGRAQGCAASLTRVAL